MTRFTTYPRAVRKSTAGILRLDDRTLFLIGASLLLSLSALVVSYLILMNSMTQRSFAMKSLESEIVELKREEKRLQVELAQKESITKLSDRIPLLGMVPTEKMEYVTVGTGIVARR